MQNEYDGWRLESNPFRTNFIWSTIPIAKHNEFKNPKKEFTNSEIL